MRGHISISHCEEGDGYEPQCSVHAACLYLLLPIGGDSIDIDMYCAKLQLIETFKRLVAEKTTVLMNHSSLPVTSKLECTVQNLTVSNELVLKSNVFVPEINLLVRNV